MSKMIYLDTNVWLDYVLGSTGVYPLDEFARRILERSIDCEFIICVSDLLEFELKKYSEGYKELFLPLENCNKLRKVFVNSRDKKQAKNIQVHFPDNIHVYLAKKYGCDYFVTNDKEILSLNIDLEIVSSQFFQFK